MKILVINGSPKGKRSNTYKLTSSFINGISETNEIEYEEIIVKDKNIGTCIGCFGCWNKTPGICVIKDDMKEILDKILNEQLQWRECLGESSVYMHQPYSNVSVKSKAY